jgi:hypothetical protein
VTFDYLTQSRGVCEAEPVQDNLTRLLQAVFLAHKGLLGIIYWYLQHNVHKLTCAEMCKKLAIMAERA